MNLHLYERPARGSEALMDLTPLIVREGYRDTIRAVGGQWTAAWEFRPELGLARLAALYESALGCAVRRVSYGMARWEGYIAELRLVAHGAEYVRSLEPEWFHNRVRAYYSSDIGERGDTGWSENTDSSDEYGELNYVLSLGGATADGAAALVQAHLAAYGWPRSRMTGSLTPRRATNQTLRLTAVALGFWHTLNWRYRETTLSGGASTVISTLRKASEFVTVEQIDTNSLSVRCDAFPIPQRLGDLIEGVISQGDASGNLWRGGVYGRRLVYDQAPTTARYTWRNGSLFEGGARVDPELADAGELIYNGDAPTGGQPPGQANVWDDPRVGYVDEVAYAGDGSVALRLWGADEGVALLDERLRRGGV